MLRFEENTEYTELKPRWYIYTNQGARLGYLSDEYQEGTKAYVGNGTLLYHDELIEIANKLKELNSA